MTIIATWNVNSVRARLPRVLEWLDEFKPDIALLQELKATDETFPRLEIEDRGYNIEIHGQKNFNGVGILSKSPIEDVTRGLPNNEDDDQARYIEGFTAGLRVASIYLPNGNPTFVEGEFQDDGSPVLHEKYEYKLRWMECLHDHMAERLTLDEAIVFGGDYNIVPTDEDVHDAEGWANDALCLPQSRNRFRRLLHLGLTDAYRVIHQEPHKYSFLGLPTRGMAERFRRPDRSSAAVAPGDGPPEGLRYRPRPARQGKGIRSHPCLVRNRMSPQLREIIRFVTLGLAFGLVWATVQFVNGQIRDFSKS